MVEIVEGIKDLKNKVLTLRVLIRGVEYVTYLQLNPPLTSLKNWHKFTTDHYILHNRSEFIHVESGRVTCWNEFDDDIQDEIYKTFIEDGEVLKIERYLPCF
jgi:hypothetical protein